MIISIHYGFGRHQADILASPNGMQSLIQAAFWQTTGYCKRLNLQTSMRLLIGACQALT